MKRLWKAVHDHVSAGGPRGVLDAANLTAAQREMRHLAHQTLVKVTDDVGRRRTFNTAIAAVMELMNALAKFEDGSPQGRAVAQEALEFVVLMLSPIVPHAAHALWHELGHAGAIVDAPWPKPDEEALARETIELVVQVNGKLRSQIHVATDADNPTIEAAALADANVQRFIDGKPIRKVIVVKGRLVNVVV
jgi:leucyl-tRNA synthetase